jgi:hypothetical protein
MVNIRCKVPASVAAKIAYVARTTGSPRSLISAWLIVGMVNHMSAESLAGIAMESKPYTAEVVVDPLDNLFETEA